ncbi:phosphoglycolate phosphatase [Xylella taiwanensis]|uniref:Phosphoglycolate phosphatase n=1 Tax=Xylella taiwanensis TaxID=1444770 RepID=Z9JHM3_9GAMM|nr:phosphoglycolate phosphatase [Xylella taiwanensis]AXI83185.1 phosphoglycolate phosphatase [Xylella taiwanensis]EWS77900.1 phosphoglycolate phosphatase [Xylella taiwanensis]MCD8456234.1 phosphoglycolate phosphatase [Xylella taiwanensis]MCD8458642.1 phosphoglycolate phosphatase [Xylella taiwanensis]MCD8460777.1 phosphoglycolate phosphatase [Xylella taiwanensis]
MPLNVLSRTKFPRAVLFDLDGTLLDSAPDMLATANAMLAARGRAPLKLAQLRPVVSKGAYAIITVAFPELDAAALQGLVPEFLQRYEVLIGSASGPFDGVEVMLDALERAGTVWGIVTNKAEFLARLILPLLGWASRCAVLIGGDTLAQRKPHPLPLLTAAERIGVMPGECVYVGDDVCDILAARAAGMPSVVALWGYRPHEDNPRTWQADGVAGQPQVLSQPDAWPGT